jgi:hypothetical protein
MLNRFQPKMRRKLWPPEFAIFTAKWRCSVDCLWHWMQGHAHNRPQGSKRVPGRLRPRNFLTFGTTRVVGRQPHTLSTFTPSGNPWYSFLEAESTPKHMVPSVATEKIPSVTPPGIDPETVRLVAQCLNHYTILGPRTDCTVTKFCMARDLWDTLLVFEVFFLKRVWKNTKAVRHLVFGWIRIRTILYFVLVPVFLKKIDK